MLTNHVVVNFKKYIALARAQRETNDKQCSHQDFQFKWCTLAFVICSVCDYVYECLELFRGALEQLAIHGYFLLYHQWKKAVAKWADNANWKSY